MKRLAVLVACVVLSGAMGAQTPDTPAGRQFGAWLSAFNSGDNSTIQLFMEKNQPDRPVAQTLAFRKQTGGFDVKRVDESTATRIVVLAQERNSDQFARLTLAIDSEQSSRITQLGIVAVPRPPEFAVPRLSAGELAASLAAKLDKDTVADRFSGAVLVAKNQQVLFRKAYGLADREKKAANALDTRFRIGSMNKMFTAVATLQLVQAGKITLTDPLGKFVPDYPNRDISAKVTIHQLLTHTGGTGDFFGPEYQANRLKLRTLNDYVTWIGPRGPAFEPGSRWAYSNYGMLLLGVVIERVTGQSYYDSVAEHVYKPAGMTRSGSEPEAELGDTVSVGYMLQRGTGVLTPNTDTLPFRGNPAGGGYSTVDDLMNFADALSGHRLLNADYTALLITGKVESAPGRMYAYGFEDRRTGDGGFVGHTGGAPGMNGELRIYPGRGYVVVSVANLDPPAAQQVVDFIDLRLPR